MSLLGFAWASSLAQLVGNVCGLRTDEASLQTATAIIAVFFVFTLNASIQPLQSGLRTLIVDLCPQEQQQAASAWVGRITSMANVLGYLASFADLPHLFPILGSSQFRALCLIISTVLFITVSLTCWTVREKDPILETNYSENQDTAWVKLRCLLTSFHRLPPRVQQVFRMQFFAWIGWFPFLFYITT